MRGFRMMAMVVVLAAVAAGCGGGGDDDESEEDVSPSTSAVATTAAGSATTAATGPATNLTLRVAEVRLVNSEESDSGMRILLPAGVASASVTLTGLPTPNRVISVCQARELDRRLSGAACRMPANGEAITITLGTAASGVELNQVGVSGPGPEGNSALLDEVVIRYAASSRELNVRLPQIAAGGSGGRPTFTLTPAAADGAYQATLAWTVIAVYGGSPSSAQLELLQGGNATNRAVAGGAEVRLNGNVSPAGEAAIRVQNVGTSALVSPRLTLLLP